MNPPDPWHFKRNFVWIKTMDESEKEEEVGRRVRRVSKVMAIVFMLWFAAQWFGARLGLPDIVLPILDFAALFTFLWALIEIWMIFRIIRKQ